MKYEKELKFLWNLYNCRHCKDIANLKFSSTPGFKKDFERIVGSGENSEEFNRWFKKLINDGVFVFVGKVSHNSSKNVVSNGYVIDVKKLVKYSKLNPYYSNAKKFFSVDRII